MQTANNPAATIASAMLIILSLTFIQLKVNLLEVYTKIDEESIVMGAYIIVIDEVCDSELVADFSIELVVLSTAAQLEAHVVAVYAGVFVSHSSCVLVRPV